MHVSRTQMLRLLGVGLIATLGITACGSDSSSSDATAAPGTAAPAATDAATATTAASSATDAATATDAAAADTTAAPAVELPAAELSLVAYSTPQAAYEQIIAAFHKTTQGKNITFTQSYGASGDQSRAVVAGLGSRHRRLLAGARHDPPGQGRAGRRHWNTDQYEGMVTDSVVVLGDPQGQPEEHQDLGRPDQARRRGDHAEPVHLGWRALEHHGRLRPGAARAAAPKPTAPPTSTRLFKNVPVQDDSARKSLQTFTSGKGDVMLSYENEAIFAQQNGQAIDYIVPDSTILIENPVAVTTTTNASRAGQGVPRLPPHARRHRRSSPTTATARWSTVSTGPFDFPTPDRPVHHRRPRRLDGRDDEVLRPDTAASWPTSRRHRRLRWLTSDARRCVRRPRTVPRPAAQRAWRGRTPAPSFGVGLATLYLSLIVLIPLGAVVWRSPAETASPRSGTPSPARKRSAAMRLTVACGLLVALINVVMGTLIAWVLVRDDFPGKRLVDALIDLPFALPTIVAGLVLLTLYGPTARSASTWPTRVPGVVVALLFVTLPFVVRTVQPVLIELDREMEEAAASLGAEPFTTFRRIILPNLVPAISAGTALAFARAISEFGATVLISGNLPFKTQVAAVHIFNQIQSDNTTGAAAVSTVLLRRRARRAPRTRPAAALGDRVVGSSASKYILRIVALGYLVVARRRAGRAGLLAHVRARARPGLDALTDPAVLHALPRHGRSSRSWRSSSTPSSASAMAILLVRHRFPGRRLLNALIDLPLAVSPVVVGLALILVYGKFAPIGGWLDDHGIQIIFCLPGMVLATIFVSLPLVVREVVPVLEEIGIEQEQAAWTLGASTLPDLPAHHACRRSGGRSPTASC